MPNQYTDTNSKKLMKIGFKELQKNLSWIDAAGNIVRVNKNKTRDKFPFTYNGIKIKTLLEIK